MDTKSDHNLSQMLFLRVAHGHVKRARSILNNRPDLAKSQNPNGDTIAHVAARNGDLNMLKMIASIDPTLLEAPHGSGNGCTPWDMAMTSGYRQIASAINELSQPPAPLPLSHDMPARILPGRAAVL